MQMGRGRARRTARPATPPLYRCSTGQAHACEMDANAPGSIVWPIGWRRHTTSPHRRNLRWSLLLISAILVGVVSFWLVSFAASNAHTVSTAFAFTGSSGLYVVPADVCRIRIEAIGAVGPHRLRNDLNHRPEVDRLGERLRGDSQLRTPSA